MNHRIFMPEMPHSEKIRASIAQRRKIIAEMMAEENKKARARVDDILNHPIPGNVVIELRRLADKFALEPNKNLKPRIKRNIVLVVQILDGQELVALEITPHNKKFADARLPFPVKGRTQLNDYEMRGLKRAIFELVVRHR